MLCPFVVEDERPDYMRDGATDDSDLLDVVLVEEARAALPSPSQTSPASQPAASTPTVARMSSATSMHPVGTILARELATLQDSCGPVRGLLGVTERMLVFEPLRSEPWVQVHGAARFRCVLTRSQVLAYVWWFLAWPLVCSQPVDQLAPSVRPVCLSPPPGARWRRPQSAKTARTL